MDKDQRIEARKRAKKRYDRLKAEGVCTNCAVNKTPKGRVTCSGCLANHKKYHMEAKQNPEYKLKCKNQLKYWRDRNLAYCNVRRKAYLKKLRDAVFTHYGGACVCCGEREFVFLSIDHINNDGKEDRKDTNGSGGAVFYRRIQKLNYTTTLQLLCHNCNQAKRILGYCLHHPEWPCSHAWYADHCTNCGCDKSTQVGIPCTPLTFAPKRPMIE